MADQVFYKIQDFSQPVHPDVPKPITPNAPLPAPPTAPPSNPDLASTTASSVMSPPSTPVSRSAAAMSIPRVPECSMHKNRLQQYAQRASLPLPLYQAVNEGADHAPKFRATVLVDGTQYSSLNTFPNRKAAEQDVAKIALEHISKKVEDKECPFIHEDTIFCKSILNEFAVKMSLEKPKYNTVQPQGLLPIFKTSLVFNGITYTGDTGRTKKEAEQLAARTVILSLMGNSGQGTMLSEIIRSKAKLYAAVNRVDLTHEKKSETADMIGHSPASGGSSQAASGTHHEFKIERPQTSLEAVNLPIEFVHPIVGQSLDVGPSSAKKRRKNRNKSNKKMRNNDQQSVSSVPLSQAAPCSVTQ